MTNVEFTSDVVRSATFREKLKGYNPEDVHAFMERSAAAIDQLTARLADATARALKAEAALASNSEADESVRRTLVLAQRTAEMAVREANDEAATIRVEARREADQLLSDARAGSERLEAEAADRAAKLTAEAERARSEADQYATTTTAEADAHAAAVTAEADNHAATITAEAEARVSHLDEMVAAEAATRRAEAFAAVEGETADARAELEASLANLGRQRDQLWADVEALSDYLAAERARILDALQAANERFGETLEPAPLPAVERPEAPALAAPIAEPDTVEPEPAGTADDHHARDDHPVTADDEATEQRRPYWWARGSAARRAEQDPAEDAATSVDAPSMDARPVTPGPWAEATPAAPAMWRADTTPPVHDPWSLRPDDPTGWIQSEGEHEQDEWPRPAHTDAPDPWASPERAIDEGRDPWAQPTPDGDVHDPWGGPTRRDIEDPWVDSPRRDGAGQDPWAQPTPSDGDAGDPWALPAAGDGDGGEPWAHPAAGDGDGQDPWAGPERSGGESADPWGPPAPSNGEGQDPWSQPAPAEWSPSPDDPAGWGRPPEGDPGWPVPRGQEAPPAEITGHSKAWPPATGDEVDTPWGQPVETSYRPGWAGEEGGQRAWKWPGRSGVTSDPGPASTWFTLDAAARPQERPTRSAHPWDEAGVATGPAEATDPWRAQGQGNPSQWSAAPPPTWAGWAEHPAEAPQAPDRWEDPAQPDSAWPGQPAATREGPDANDPARPTRLLFTLGDEARKAAASPSDAEPAPKKKNLLGRLKG